MIYKVGDKLLCKTNSVISCGAKSTYYTKGRYYKVISYLGNTNEIILIENDLVGVVQSPRNIFFQKEVSLNFCNKKEVRKLKLEKIEKNKN